MRRRFNLAAVNAADSPQTKFPSAYCRSKPMSVASCIHSLLAAAGKKVPTHFESKPNRRRQHLDELLYRSKSDDENCWFTEMFSYVWVKTMLCGMIWVWV